MTMVEWVVVSKDGKKMACERCGETYPIAVPVRVSTFIELSKAFVRAHESCEKRGAKP